MAKPADDIRILVCGPRDCPHQRTAEQLVLSLKEIDGDALTIVTGGCKTGTDAHVLAACIEHGVRCEVNPADWKRYNNPAGPIRNRAMATRGARACYALVKPPDGQPVRGTGQMVGEARKAGIVRYRVTTATNGAWVVRALEAIDV